MTQLLVLLEEGRTLDAEDLGVAVLLRFTCSTQEAHANPIKQVWTPLRKPSSNAR